MSTAGALRNDGLPDYRLLELLYSGARTVVYRALEATTQRSVIIKRLLPEYPTFNDLLRFRNQYTIAHSLTIPGIVHAERLIPDRHSYALVMEDCGGISLGVYVRTHPLTLAEVLAIAIQLATILHDLYQHRVMHKDIKPANILIHPETQQIKLIDFSIASLLPKETEEIKHPNVLEGTLAYIAPEQTGRMNRGVDYRADFYALGVTLFELLTGQLPFQSDDPLELVHCHIAKPAPSICDLRPEVPAVMGQIVTKLMAKNVEDRYQSALGLKYDLEVALHQLNTTGTIDLFELATRDRSDRFGVPEKLYGREQEVRTLLDAFDRVAGGASELMLVAGFSGIGKTAVVNEVHKPIVKQRGYFIKGKFDQFNRNIPFSAFVQAFRDLMGQLLSESEAQLQQWQTKILAALGENAQVIIEVMPELEQIIGKQPSVPDLSGNAVQNRFNLMFEKFIQVFTTREHPLVMFLDDLQWVDSASLKLMKLLMSDRDQAYLFLIGAYRDNEVSAAHSLILTLEEIQRLGAIVNTITLAPLHLLDVNKLIADTLSCSPELAFPLTELVYQKTKGNPFFNNQFVQVLQKEGLISFNQELGYWQCDIAQIKALVLTDDVVKFMALQLQKLSRQTQEILKTTSCIGNQFDLETLAIVSEKSEIEVAMALWPALKQGLILPISQIYKFYVGWDRYDVEPDSQTVNYRFLHDRVQQAAYSLIPDTQKQTIHCHIGQLLLQKISPESREDRIFELVNQLNYGTALIAQPSQRDELAQLNLLAGQKAIAATAHAAALNYATIGIGLLAPDCWDDRYPLALQLHEIAAEAAYLTGDLSQMDHWIEIVMRQSQTILDRIEVIEVKLQSYAAQNQHLEAITLALDTLEQLGVSLPKSPTHEAMQQEFNHIYDVVSRYSPEELLHLPVMSDPDKLAASQILAHMSGVTSIAAPTLLPMTLFCQVQLALDYGNSPFSAHGYVGYGVLVHALLQDSETCYQMGQLSLELIEQSNSNAINAKIFQLVGAYTIHWKRHIRETLPFFDRACASALENGDLEFLGYATMTKCQYLYFLGQELTELDQVMADHNDNLAKFRQKASLSWNQVFRQAVLNLIFPSDEPWSLTGDLLKEDEFVENHRLVNDRLGLHYFYSHKLILCNIFGAYEQGLKSSHKAQEYLDGSVGFLNVPVFYFHDSLVRLENWMTATEEQRAEFLEAIDSNQEKMRGWAENGPMNYQHKWDLVEAEKQRVLQNYAAAIDYYDRAIASAKANGFMQDEALSNELAAKFYLNWGKEKFAALYIQEAYQCYERWGAKAKTEDLTRRYPTLLPPILNIATSETTNRQVTPSAESTQVSAVLDLNTVLKASQALSREIHLDQLLQSLIQLVITNAGADKAALFLNNDDSLELRIKYCDQAFQAVQHKPVDQCLSISHGLIHYVEHTLEPVITDFQTHVSTLNDPYCLQFQPKSLLCTPILNQGQLVAILYLENTITAGTFTLERVELLNVLCAQAAISLVNARLYEQSQSYAHELERSLADLSASKARLQKISNNTPGVIYQICINPKDGSSFTSYISPGCTDLYEVAPEAILSGQYSLQDFEHPDDHPSINQVRQQSEQKMTPFRHEWRIITPSGKVKWVQSVAQPERQANGLMVWEGIVIDISDRKQSEIALQNSEAHYRALVSAIPDLIMRVSRDGVYLEFVASPNFRILGGMSDWIGVHVTVELPAEAAQQRLTAIRNALETQTIQIYEQVLCIDGELQYEEVRAVPYNQDEVLLLVRDISDRKRAEAAQKRQLAILESTSDFIGSADPSGKVLYLNQAWRQLLRQEGDTPANQDIISEHHPAWAVELIMNEALPAAMHHGMWIGETALLNGKGEEIPVSQVVIAHKSSQGDIEYFSTIARDISDRKAAEQRLQQQAQQLEQANQQLEDYSQTLEHRVEERTAELKMAQERIIAQEKLASLGTLTAGVAHELRNPLNFVKNYAEGSIELTQDLLETLHPLIQTQPQDSANLLQGLINDLQDNATTIRRHSQRAEQIIATMMEHARTQNETADPQPTPLHDFLTEAVKLAYHSKRMQDSNFNITIETDYDPQVNLVNLVPGTFIRAIINLIDNACDAMRYKQHQLEIDAPETLAHYTPTLHITTHLQDNQVELSIRDNGCGIDPQIQSQILDPFFTTKASGEGTGLGLSLTHDIIVKQHQGTLTLQSELGQFTEVLVTLPHSGTNNTTLDQATRAAVAPPLPNNTEI